MEVGGFVVIAISVVGAVWFRAYRNAIRIVRARSEELSAVTGIPAERIEEEIRRRRMTPGDWARAHGLDPLTFRPTTDPTRPEQGAPSGRRRPSGHIPIRRRRGPSQ